MTPPRWLSEAEILELARLEREATPGEAGRLRRLLTQTNRIESGCWEFTGRRNQRGYGLASFHQVTTTVHRIVWAILNGGMPGRDTVICHRCDNPPCIRPDHLFAGTQSDNMRDRLAKGRKPPGSNWNGNQRESARMAMKELQAKQAGKPRPWAKLTAAQVDEIRTCGGTQRIVARRFGIDQSLVSQIRRRRVWRDYERE